MALSWVQLHRAYFYCFFFFRIYKCALHTKRSFYYICVIHSAYMLLLVCLFLTNIVFYIRTHSHSHIYTHVHKYCTSTCRISFLHVHHIHFAHLFLKEYPLFMSNAIQLYNNLKKCIIYIYMYKDSRNHSKR